MKIVETQPVVRRQSPQGGATVTLPARPEAIAFAPQETALIVVDMQNAYASQGDIWIWPGSTFRPPPR